MRIEFDGTYAIYKMNLKDETLKVFKTGKYISRFSSGLEKVGRLMKRYNIEEYTDWSFGEMCSKMYSDSISGDGLKLPERLLHFCEHWFLTEKKVNSALVNEEVSKMTQSEFDKIKSDYNTKNNTKQL